MELANGTILNTSIPDTLMTSIYAQGGEATSFQILEDQTLILKEVGMLHRQNQRQVTILHFNGIIGFGMTQMTMMKVEV